MHADLKKLLEAQERIQAQIAEAQAKYKQEGIDQIHSIMQELGITASDLGLYDVETLRPGKWRKGWPMRQVNKAPMPALYRDPATGKTWSGKGRQPGWIEGNKDEYLIDKKPKQQAA